MQRVGLFRHLLSKYPQKSAVALLLTATSFHLPGPRKKRDLFFLLMEWSQYDRAVLQEVNDLAEKTPQHFSRPVLDKLNRVLPLAMKVPQPLRRLAAVVLGLKNPRRKSIGRRSARRPEFRGRIGRPHPSVPSADRAWPGLRSGTALV